MRKFRIPLTALGLAFCLAGPAPGADHLDAPGLTSPGNDGRLDIPDLFAFQSPTDPDQAVLIVTLNPLAGLISPTTLHPEASYELAVDQDGDAKADLTFKITFSAPDASGDQDVTLRCTPAASCPNGAVLATGRTGENIAIAGGGTLRVDVFDDPFFFDLNAFLGAYDFCSAPGGPAGSSGSDFFAGANVSAIVMELPADRLGPDNVGVWAVTTLGGEMVDRMGRPAINTVFIPSASKNEFNETKPRKDVQKFSDFLGGFAGLLLPDILTVDTSSAAGFLNGRQPADDVIDAELALIGIPPGSDCVDENDVPFPGVFPYLAPAH